MGALFAALLALPAAPAAAHAMVQAAAQETAQAVASRVGPIQDRDALVQALDSAARAYVEGERVPGVSVAVVRGADTLLLRGYGFVELEGEVPTPPDASAVYEIGSVTKQFTAAALLTLVAEGRVDLDADVTEYLPDYDTGGHRIPVRRLLDHTSGIKGYTEMPSFWSDISTVELPRDSLVALIGAEPLEFEPGTAQIYNNSAYFLLGLLIEAVSGQSYEEVVRERLFEPAGMASSSYCSQRAVRPGTAHGYDASADGLVHKGYLDHTWPYAAGSLCSTAGDLVRWNRALHGGEILSPDGYRAMTTPGTLVDGSPLDYAMGLTVGGREASPNYFHGGGINGFLSYTSYHSGDDVVLVVLQNSAAPPGPASLAETFTDLLWGPDPEPETVAYPGEVEALVGEYAGPARGRHLHMTVTQDGDALVFAPAGAEEGMRARHVGDGVWRSGGTRFWFEAGADRARQLMMAQSAARYPLVRVR